MQTNFVYLIANPISGSGNGQTILNQVITHLKHYHIPYALYVTEYEKHAYSLAKKVAYYCQKRPRAKCLVIGGDGTLHEVIDAFHQENIICPIAYLPAGTGNDFARNFQSQLPLKQKLLYLLNQKKTTAIPLLKLEDTIILNSGDFGFGAQVVASVKHSRLKGLLKKIHLSSLIYFIHVLLSVFTFKTVSCSITIDNKQYVLDNVFLVALLNHGYCGGGIHLDPSISLNDPFLHVLVIQNIRFKDAFSLIPALFKKTHLQNSKIQVLKGQTATITPLKPCIAQIDGEVLKQTASFTAHITTQLFWLPE